MKKITRKEAVVLGVSDKSYVLREIATNRIFQIDVATMHERVVFPTGIIDGKGLIKAQSQVAVVMKRTSSGNTVFLPDTSRYPQKEDSLAEHDRNGETTNEERIAVETIIDIAKTILKKHL